MNVISLKDYANNNNISYEAVRQQVARYKKELGSHIIKDGRQQFLDDEAVAFLNERRKKNPVVILQMDKDEEIERLHGERQRLLEELNEAKSRIIDQQDRLYALAGAEQKMMLLEASSEAAEKKASDLEVENRALITQKIKTELKLEETKKDLQEANFDLETAKNKAKANEQEATRAKAEAEDLRQQLDDVARYSIFDFLRFRKAKKRAKAATLAAMDDAENDRNLQGPFENVPDLMSALDAEEPEGGKQK